MNKISRLLTVLIVFAGITTALLYAKTGAQISKPIQPVAAQAQLVQQPTGALAQTKPEHFLAQVQEAQAGPAVTVPVLVYHYIRINPDPKDTTGQGLSVTPQNFAAQMDYLAQVGAHTATLADLASALHGGPALPPRSVILTFDDGHDDFATQAAPILQAHGFVGTDFVVTGFLGRASYMTEDQVRQVSQMGMVIGAHTTYHIKLTASPQLVAQNQINESKTTLEKITGQPVLDFAYPYGAFNNQLEQVVQKAGFRDAVSTVGGYTDTPSQLYELRRIHVTGNDSLASFATRCGLPRP